MRWTPLLLGLSLLGCVPVVGEPDAKTGEDGSSDDEVETDLPPGDVDLPGGDVGGDTGMADTSGGDTASGDTGTAAPATGHVRFIALGDAGEGNADQYAVAKVVEQVCAARGCDFALYLGDNFYDDGVFSVDDEQFQTKFELPYANLDLPFYVVLGNHDFGEIPVQFWRTDFQVEYTKHSTKWTMPDHYYDFAHEHAAFLALDTNQLMLGLAGTQGQKQWARKALRDHAGATWKIAFGHHPWKSNGRHGNAGNYEGAFYDVTGIVRGQLIKDFFVQDLCHEIDFYIDGHDHNRQWIQAGKCGVTFLVSGAGAKTTDFEHRDNNDTVWEDDQREGFVWVELLDSKATIAFYDLNGDLDYEDTIRK